MYETGTLCKRRKRVTDYTLYIFVVCENNVIERQDVRL